MSSENNTLLPVEDTSRAPRRLPSCQRCLKPQNLCVCSSLGQCASRIQFLILQHPSESRRPLSTASLVPAIVNNAILKVGLSWRSLSAVLGRPVDPANWAVLYLGTKNSSSGKSAAPLLVLNRKGKTTQCPALEGVVILDGNWKQSKTLWWRNAWLLRLKRVILNPRVPSGYSSLRRQPRTQSLCTLESVLFVAKELGESPALIANLESGFDLFLEKAKKGLDPHSSSSAGPMVEGSLGKSLDNLKGAFEGPSQSA